MKKLHLELDQLEVESFPTTDLARADEGTVRGHGSGYGCSTGCSETQPIDNTLSADANCGRCLFGDTVNTSPNSDCATAIDVC